MQYPTLSLAFPWSEFSGGIQSAGVPIIRPCVNAAESRQAQAHIGTSWVPSAELPKDPACAIRRPKSPWMAQPAAHGSSRWGAMQLHSLIGCELRLFECYCSQYATFVLHSERGSYVIYSTNHAKMFCPGSGNSRSSRRRYQGYRRREPDRSSGGARRCHVRVRSRRFGASAIRSH